MHFRLKIFIFSLMGTLLSCGVSPANEQSRSQFIGNSWSTQVGGSLAFTNPADLLHYDYMKFYRVIMPVGFGVNHEFIGIYIQGQQGSMYLTTGLVGDSDLPYFKKLHKPLGSKHLLPITSYKVSNQSLSLLHKINQEMSQSHYHNRVLYFAAMASTPLSGRPCANTAAKLESFIHKNIN